MIIGRNPRSAWPCSFLNTYSVFRKRHVSYPLNVKCIMCCTSVLIASWLLWERWHRSHMRTELSLPPLHSQLATDRNTNTIYTSPGRSWWWCGRDQPVVKSCCFTQHLSVYLNFCSTHCHKAVNYSSKITITHFQITVPFILIQYDTIS